MRHGRGKEREGRRMKGEHEKRENKWIEKMREREKKGKTNRQILLIRKGKGRKDMEEEKEVNTESGRQDS